MDEFAVLGYDDERYAVRRFLAQYDAPAYVRRALQVDAAYAGLLSRCQRQRARWLEFVRLRIGVLAASVGDWDTLEPLLESAAQVAALRQLHQELQPRLRVAIEQQSSSRVLRGLLGELQESMARFNTKWRVFVGELDLGEINALRADYNRYYLVEKECAVRSPNLARRGFRKLPPLATADLEALFPPLPELRLRD